MFSISGFAAQSFSGFIYNDNKTPVNGAIITLLNPETQEAIDYTLSDEKGFFMIENIKKSNYIASINALGYSKIENKINIVGDLKINYNL